MATVPKAKGMPPFTMTDLLLRGHPGELLPEDLQEAQAAAQWMAKDTKLPESARARILAVWIAGEHQRAWDPKGDNSTPAAREEVG